MSTQGRLSTDDLVAPRPDEPATEPVEAPREMPTADAADPRDGLGPDGGMRATDAGELRVPDAAGGRAPDSGAGWEPLLPEADAGRFRERWTEIQTGFVDRPRESVGDADTLVAELMQRLAQGFAAERGTLEAQLDREEDVDTEDMRIALQRYRSFFERLLAA